MTDNRDSFVQRKQEEQAGVRSGLNFALVSAITQEVISALALHQATVIEGLAVVDGVVRVLADRAFTSAGTDAEALDRMKNDVLAVVHKMESFVIAWPITTTDQS